MTKQIKLTPVSKGHKPKGAHGMAAVKAIGRTKTTGNFKKIEAVKGKGAAIAAYQNKLKAFKSKRKRMTVAEDKSYDKKHGIKEGSKKDIAMDKKHGVKDRKHKRSSGTPSGAKNPFGTIKTDKLAGAGKTMYPNILSKTSPQNKLDTGKSLLKKAMKRVARAGR